jgi:LysR family hydrogen peroxide-inducible transcriptional activator
MAAALKAGAVDAVLACPPENRSGFFIHALFVEPFLLMHRPERRPAWPLVDRDDPMVLLDEGHCLRDQALETCQPAPRLATSYATGIEMLRYLVAAGEGVSLLPALAARAMGTGHGQLTFTPLPDPGIGREVVLLARRSDPRVGRMTVLADVIRRARMLMLE